MKKISVSEHFLEVLPEMRKVHLYEKL